MVANLKQEKPTRPILRYHGGKWLLAPWIISYFPTHRIYVEPYCGGASVFLQKPRAHSELLNDIDGEVVNLFRVLRSDEAPKLIEHLRLTPYARDEYALALQPSEDPLERARRLVVSMAFRFTARDAHSDLTTAFRAVNHTQNKPSQRVWADYPDHLMSVVNRLLGVVIENKPALEIIEAHDSSETLFYCDPPYPLSTRHSKEKTKAYKHEMSDDEHRLLAGALHRVEGMVVLSGYACELYDCELYPTWFRAEREALADGSGPRTEVLWLNSSAHAALERERYSLFATPEAVGERG